MWMGQWETAWWLAQHLTCASGSLQGREKGYFNSVKCGFSSILFCKKWGGCPVFGTEALLLFVFPWRRWIANFSTPWNEGAGFVYFQHPPGNEAVTFIILELEGQISFLSRCRGTATKFTMFFPKAEPRSKSVIPTNYLVPPRAFSQTCRLRSSPASMSKALTKAATFS